MQGGIEVFPVLDLCYFVSICMIDQAVKLSAISAAYHWISVKGYKKYTCTDRCNGGIIGFSGALL